jgi:hypothetical protein
MIGAPAGLVLGGAVGADIQSVRWRARSLNALRVTVEPRGGAIGVGVSIAF